MKMYQKQFSTAILRKFQEMEFGGWDADSKHEELSLKFTNKTFNWIKTDAATSYQTKITIFSCQMKKINTIDHC